MSCSPNDPRVVSAVDTAVRAMLGEAGHGSAVLRRRRERPVLDAEARAALDPSEAARGAGPSRSGGSSRPESTS